MASDSALFFLLLLLLLLLLLRLLVLLVLLLRLLFLCASSEAMEGLISFYTAGANKVVAEFFRRLSLEMITYYLNK